MVIILSLVWIALALIVAPVWPALAAYLALVSLVALVSFAFAYGVRRW